MGCGLEPASRLVRHGSVEADMQHSHPRRAHAHLVEGIVPAAIAVASVLCFVAVLLGLS